MHRRFHRSLRVAACAASLVWAASTVPSSAEESAPVRAPASRAEALAHVDRLLGVDRCLTPHIEDLLYASQRGPLGARRAAGILLAESAKDARDFGWRAADGTRVRLAPELHLGPLDSAGAKGEAVPGPVHAAIEGLDAARSHLVEGLGLEAPRVELVLAAIGGGRGYTIAQDPDGLEATIVLDAAPPVRLDALRAEAAHQFGHAAARLAGLDPFWSEVLGRWTELESSTELSDELGDRIAERFAQLDAGLFRSDLRLAGGNAAWLAFLQRAYGPTLVRVSIEELGADGPAREAFAQAFARTTDEGLDGAFREFHLWTLLTGSRADRHHFPFADRLPPPAFASTTVGLPALSVLGDPPVTSWGAAQVRLEPRLDRGGLSVHFEGETGSSWECDLVLLEASGAIRRIPMTLSPDGRGETVVPAAGVVESWLLVRNLGGGEQDVPRSYSYAAAAEATYPFELISFSAVRRDVRPDAVELVWETASERDLVGFNVIRRLESGGAEQVVNSVWIPALGDDAHATRYQFLDETAPAGVVYRYRIEGVTRAGLTSSSPPRRVRAASAVSR